MKKYLISLGSLLFALNTMPVSALTISGTVSDDKDVLIGANIRAIDSSGQMVAGTATDLDGHFNIDIPDGAKLQISHIGYKTQTIEKPEQNLNITLKDSTRDMKEVEKVECSRTTISKLNALQAEWDPEKRTCIATVCPGPVPYEYGIQQDGSCKKIKCTAEEIDVLKGIGNALTTKVEGNGCVIDDCIGEPGEYEKQQQGHICQKVNCSKAEEADLKNKYHAAKVSVKDGKCVIEDCELKYELKGNKCVEIRCDETQGYEFNANTKQCEKTECSISEKEAILNANGIGPKWDGKQCIPTGCDDGWNLKTNKCIHDKCTKPEEDWDKNQQKCVQVRCSNEQISAANATSKSKWINGHCEFVCDEKGGFTLNGDKCVQTSCTEKDAKQMQKNNVSKYELQDGKCIALECVSNEYELSQEQNACINKKCQTPEEDVVDGECKKVKCTTQEEEAIHAKESTWDGEKCVATKCDDKVYNLDNGVCKIKDERSDNEKKNALEEKRKAYEEAKKKEQSFENRMLTAATVAATGIGAMELMQGMAEQSADKDAAADMVAYIETMRCTYGEDKQVKAGPEEIELPGANDETLMKLRSEYLALAADLKERKEALGMKPGIESEEILDRASSGLYGQENIGITGGAYASLYRAQMLQSEADQKKLDDQASVSKKRVTGGAIAFGAGVVVGIAGNSLLNGKLGELLKKKKDTKNLNAAVDTQTQAFKDLQKCLKDAGVKGTDDLKFEKFYPSVLSVKNLNCKTDLRDVKKDKAQDLFEDTDDVDAIYDKLISSFGPAVTSKMLGVTLSTPNQTDEEKQKAKDAITNGFNNVNNSIAEAAKKDADNTNNTESKNVLESLVSNVDAGSLISGFIGNNGN